MKISFHGAAGGGVTGSCHRIECAGKQILIDCGLYQGRREIEEENAESFGFEPSEIDFLLLTHAHLDHCGRTPLLVKRGFTGEIVTTAASREIARLIMMDSARLQEEEARYQNRRARRRGKDMDVIEPLYTTLDALNTLDYFGRTAVYDRPIRLAPGIEVTFIDAGHILGSSCLVLDLAEGEQKRRVLFSGDLGLHEKPILHDPADPPDVDVVVMETTYGNRQHKKLKPSIQELYDAINETMERGGNVIIPTFALERAQELLYFLHDGKQQGVLPRFLQVFLDSPMAISATEIFRRHPECYDDETAALFAAGHDPFRFEGLHFTRETAESMAINQIDSGAVIMAGSGMCTGGRVRHHLKRNIGRKNCSIVFVGYAAHGTLARHIIDGKNPVRIFGEEYPVRAKIHTIGGFSAHASQGELLAWHGRTGKPDTTFLIHGEDDSREGFARLLRDTRVEMPDLHQQYEL